MATNPEDTDADQQRRELEEIRRKFAEVGKRLGSAFEPVSPEVHQPDALLQSVPPTPERPTRPRWQWAAVVALIFALGTGFGFTLPRSAAKDDPPPPATTPAPATTQAPQVRTVPTVPESCLETARKGDQLIAMLMRANRDPTLLAKAYKEYTVASQACRKEASR
jgi:hypothetical protein